MLSTLLQHLTQNNSNRIPLFWDSSKFQDQTVSENSRVIKTIFSMFMCTQNKSICVESIKGPVSSIEQLLLRRLPYFHMLSAKNARLKMKMVFWNMSLNWRWWNPTSSFCRSCTLGPFKLWNHFSWFASLTPISIHTFPKHLIIQSKSFVLTLKSSESSFPDNPKTGFYCQFTNEL